MGLVFVFPCAGCIGGNVFKRTIDISISAAVLLLVSPVVLVSILIIRLTSPGPAIFSQTRAGRGFRTFQIFKLRTMTYADAGLSYTLGPDPRITPFGRWLRRTKIDELPQLWNVLRGDMSLVGPRPVLPELVAEFRPQYSVLLQVRPGLTDPASLKYSQEADLLASDRDPMEFFKTVVTPDKVRISEEYLRRATPWTDVLTIGMTLLVCLFPAMSRLYGALPEARGKGGIPRDEAGMRPFGTGYALEVRSAALTGISPEEEARRFPTISQRAAQNALDKWNLLSPAQLNGQSTANKESGRALRL